MLTPKDIAVIRQIIREEINRINSATVFPVAGPNPNARYATASPAEPSYFVNDPVVSANFGPNVSIKVMSETEYNEYLSKQTQD